MATDNFKWVHMKVGGRRMNLFTDTGSGYTIIPPDMYWPSMGKIQAADTILRSRGSKTPLDVKGMFQTELKTDGGGHTHTWVYVVDGDKPEPLLHNGTSNTSVACRNLVQIEREREREREING